MNYDPAAHDYVTHRTYTGPGCAICGKPLYEHKSAVIIEERKLTPAERIEMARDFVSALKEAVPCG